jgi:asparagine synthase (glutamine-hydrolysing)
MCGIAGIISPRSDSSQLDHRIRCMTQSLERRGPDDEGFAAWPGAALGHRRLAVIDRSAAGHQPMLSGDQSFGLVFNGCIYNFQALRQELTSRGRTFRSQCDTEVLLHGCQEWGVEGMVPRLRGMFAFALWDHNQRALWLVRDRLGVKPLYYATSDGEIAFASTQAALAAGGIRGEIDPQAVLEFLHYGFVSAGRSIREDVRKVPAGSILKWKDGVASQQPYWSLPAVNPRSRISFEQAVEHTEELLLEAVRLRLYADVPIGVLLSGGIDSGLICWAMAKLNANIRSFTVSTPDDDADESAAAQHTARILDIPHQLVALPQEEFPDLDSLTDAYGEPFAASSALGVLRVSQAVKPFATVLLTGDGGDDVFLGYPFHKSFWISQRTARFLPSAATAVWDPVHHTGRNGGLWGRAQHFLDFTTGGLGAVTRIQNGLPYLEQRRMLGPRLKARSLPERELKMSVPAARTLLTDILKYEQKTRFEGEFMTKVDGGTMYHALEARSPFLDQELWEFAARLPYSLRLHGGNLKAILREIARRRLGREVAFRKKRGFTIPAERWLVTRWSGALKRLEAGSVLEDEGWIQPGSLQPAIHEALQSGSAPVALWHAVVLDRWRQQNPG